MVQSIKFPDGNDTSVVPALKYKYCYYIDNIHMFGKVICSVFFLKDYNEFGHFIIKSDRGKLVLEFVNSLPVEHIGRFEEGTYDIEEVKIDGKWVNICYELYLEENSLINKKYNTFQQFPNVKSSFDIFDEKYIVGVNQFKQEKYNDAMQTFLELYKTYPKNKSAKLAVYNVACTYSKLNNIEFAVEWLNKASLEGYNDWSRILVDSDFSNIKNDSRFAQVIKTMIEKEPSMNYGCQEVKAYLITHGLESFQQQKKMQHIERLRTEM
jgi:tetratricopeptide (TPR) repeat protein